MMSELPNFDPYEVLGVDRSTDAATIKKAYRKLALQKHPDKCSDEALKQVRTDEFQRLNEAYDILGDDEKRKTHDARVNLDKLRRAVFAKRAASSSSYAPQAASQASPHAYSNGTSRGAAHYEDRAPRAAYADEEEEYREKARRYASAFESNRYASSYRESREARERAREQNERDRLRNEKDLREKRREAEKRTQKEQIREDRSHKFSYDYDDRHDRREKSSDDDHSNGSRKRSTKYSPTDKYSHADKMAEQLAEAQQYHQSARAAAPERPERPGIQRRSSVRDSYASARRSSATATPRRNVDDSLARKREKLKELDRIVQERQAAKERAHEQALKDQTRREQEARDRAATSERAERAERSERERAARESAQREAAVLREREHREREILQEREREREQREQERESRGRGRERERDTRFRSKENVEPYDARPPKLQAHRADPPKVPLRQNTEPGPAFTAAHPPMSRAATMDSMPGSNSARKRESPSKLNQSMEPDYSSSSTTGDAREKATRPAPPKKTTSYKYPSSSSKAAPAMYSRPSASKYNTQTVEPRSSRARSPVSKPSVTAERMANLATGSRRPSTSYGAESTRPSTSYRTEHLKRPTAAHSSSSQAVPVVERERGRERERDRELYGQRKPAYGSSSYARESPYSTSSSRPVAYGRQYSEEDVITSGPPRRSKREDPYYSSSGMGGYRQPPMQQVN